MKLIVSESFKESVKSLDGCEVIASESLICSEQV
jgi:hypothetical protein